MPTSILTGANPAELPAGVRRPATNSLNLKMANALGLAIADEVIE
jgi:hypothetical protein